jgi:hypothetical protein
MSTPLRERPDAPLGTLIFRAGLLPAEVIESALEEGVRTGRRLGEILVERGLIKEEDLTRLLAGQKGLPYVGLGERAIDPQAARLLGEEQAKLFCALPIAFDDGAPVVAVADPTNDVLTRNVSEAIGQPTSFVVASRTELLDAIERVYSGPAPTPAPEPEPVVSNEAPEEAPQPEPVVAHVEEPVAAETPPVVDEQPQSEAAPASEPPHETNGHHPDVSLEVAPPPAEAPLPAAPPEPAAPPPAPEPVQEAPAELVRETPAEPARENPAEPVQETPTEPVQEAAAEPVAPASPPVAPAPEEPAAMPAPEPQPALKPPSLRVPAPEPDDPTPGSARVTIRLTTGERVPVAEFPTHDGAKEHARSLIRDIADSGDEWPLVNGRFLKPETIVSVDVEPL